MVIIILRVGIPPRVVLLSRTVDVVVVGGFRLALVRRPPIVGYSATYVARAADAAAARRLSFLYPFRRRERGGRRTSQEYFIGVCGGGRRAQPRRVADGSN